jgi:hypothetical protein
MGAVKIGDESEVLVFQKLSFRQGGLHHLALFDDLVRKRAGVNRQLFVGGEEFAAFLFKKTFGLARRSLTRRSDSSITSQPTFCPRDGPKGSRTSGFLDYLRRAR